MIRIAKLMLLGFILIELGWPQSIYAQASINCERRGLTAGNGGCRQTGGGCPSGQLPREECVTYSWETCPSSVPCVDVTTNRQVCDFAGSYKAACNDCMGTGKKTWTAIGCIDTDPPGKFVAVFMNFSIGIAGGIAFLLILFGGFQVMTSAGNPEQLTAGRELVTSAVAGLLMVIFSLFILRIIGVDILGIPGFTRP